MDKFPTHVKRAQIQVLTEQKYSVKNCLQLTSLQKLLHKLIKHCFRCKSLTFFVCKACFVTEFLQMLLYH